MTSFYTFRLVAATFFGNSNLSDDQWKRVHESPPSMTIPLIVLAVLALFGGVLGVPEVMGGHEKLTHWLSGVVPHIVGEHGSHATEIILMAGTTLLAVISAVIALSLYSGNKVYPARFANRMRRVYKLLYNRYYIDEIYQACIVNPLIFLSRKFLWKGVDEVAVDGLMVHGTARCVALWSQLVSAAQNGILQRYLLFFLAGATLLVAYMLF
jgi:NADH-quinone oxidoreductase subunit L